MSALQNLRPALFLDRDGVINEDVGYMHRWEDCRFVDGIVPLLQAANRLGYITCVITNQAGIGRGLYTETDFHRLMDRMTDALGTQGAVLDAVYFSPFHPTQGIGEYRRESDCRKPGPGMLLKAADDLGLDLSESVLVGDRCTDMLAAQAAGVPSRFLFGTTESESCSNVTYTAVNQLVTIIEQLDRFDLSPR